VAQNISEECLSNCMYSFFTRKFGRSTRLEEVIIRIGHNKNLYANSETKMTNVSKLIKILMSSLVVAALVATYLSSGSKAGSTVGLKGSRQLQGGEFGIANLIAFLKNLAENPPPPRGPTPSPTPAPPFAEQQTTAVNNLLDRFNTSSTALLGFKGFDDPRVTNALNNVNASSNAIIIAAAAGTQFSQFP
jgi:hypothetical protein